MTYFSPRGVILPSPGQPASVRFLPRTVWPCLCQRAFLDVVHASPNLALVPDFSATLSMFFNDSPTPQELDSAALNTEDMGAYSMRDAH
jgi:hypothetical protein